MNILLSSFLWRVRGGLRIKDKKIPINKVWYSLFFASLFFYNIETFIIYMGTCYLSYQLYGWGKYLGALLGGKLNKEEEECELIDDLLDNCKLTLKNKSYKLVDYPKLYGFCGSCLTGFIITFLWGVALNDLKIMFVGLGMGCCYWLGSKIEKIYSLGKSGWNWGEWIFGAYLGYFL